MFSVSLWLSLLKPILFYQYPTIRNSTCSPTCLLTNSNKFSLVANRFLGLRPIIRYWFSPSSEIYFLVSSSNKISALSITINLPFAWLMLCSSLHLLFPFHFFIITKKPWPPEYYPSVQSLSMKLLI